MGALGLPNRGPTKLGDSAAYAAAAGVGPLRGSLALPGMPLPQTRVHTKAMVLRLNSMSCLMPAGKVLDPRKKVGPAS